MLICATILTLGLVIDKKYSEESYVVMNNIDDINVTQEWIDDSLIP